MKKEKTGFTLAEMLITLGVIGIISALIIPTLYSNIQNHIILTKLKQSQVVLNKIFSELKTKQFEDVSELIDYVENIENFSSINEGIIETVNWHGAEMYQANNWLRAMYMYCENKKCSSTEGNAFRGYISTMNGIGYDFSKTNVVDSKVNNNKCLVVSILTGPNDNSYNTGRNIFYFMIYDNFIVEPAVYKSDGSIHPYSNSKTEIINNGCSKDNTSVISGRNCAAKIKLDNWNIKY